VDRHTPQAGSANIDGGVTIDLQSMNQVNVSSDEKKVSIGPGNRWGNVYPKLDDLNLAMIGGRLSPVGAGGLITGGGISFFSARYGFACDNIEEFEIVLADGSITTASQSTKSDLFKALKGGSNNFGVVTRFDAKLRPQEAFWGGQLAHPITNKDAVFEFLSNLTVSETYDPYVALIVSIGWVTGILPVIAHNVVYTNGEVSWPPAAYAPLEEMPKVASTIRKAKLASFTDEAANTASVTSSRNNLLHSLTVVNDPVIGAHFLEQVYALSDATAQELLLVTGMIFSLSLQPMPYVLYSKSADTGGNVLGLDRFEDDLINLLYTLSWQLPTDNAIVDAAMQKLENSIVELAKSNGIFNEFVYLNYGAHWQNPIQGYGDENVEFLRSVSTKYDPDGLFQKGVPGGFKLGL
jgi:FAD/FMN-containing dehydrogenase